MMESFLSGKVELHAGDMLAVLPTLPENSIDSVVCDPPYHLTSIVKRFGGENAAPAKSNGATGVYGRASAGFMGKVWDGGDIAFDPETWRQVYRVLKPGAHLLALGGTRTFARMSVAIEDAGFEIRDTIMWLYGSGFPKSLDISRAIDRAAGHSRGTTPDLRNGPNTRQETKGDKYSGGYLNQIALDAGPVSEVAAQWSGFGTALKPACEPIVLARKPLSEKTVAANVLRWGTGALNIDSCRVATEPGDYASGGRNDLSGTGWGHKDNSRTEAHSLGRWPANVITDGSDEVVGMFPETADSKPGIRNNNNQGHEGWSSGTIRSGPLYSGHCDSGSAARFFYTAKADSDDRIGSKHPTVKPLDLIQYGCRLITPPGGTVLDCFAGTGTTGEAAFREGFRAVLIEREPEYCDDIRRRMALVLAGPDERARESVKAKFKDKPQDAGPLFSDAPAYDSDDDIRQSVQVGLQAVKQRKAAGGEGWPPD